MKKPDNVSTAGALLLAGGIFSLLVSFGLALGSLGCWVPAWAFGIPCAIYTIVKGARMLGDRAYGMGVPKGAAIVEIIQIINMDVIGMTLGIVALVMLNDADAEAYLNATRPLESFQPGGMGAFGQSGQGYNPNAPGYGQAAPGYGQAPPGFGQAPPGYGQAPPGYGQAAPGYGQAAPGYGQAPPGQVGPGQFGNPGSGVGQPGGSAGGPPPFPGAGPGAESGPGSSFVPRQWGEDVSKPVSSSPPAADPWKASVGLDADWNIPASPSAVKAEPAASSAGYQVAPWSNPGPPASGDGGGMGRSAGMRKTSVEQAIDVSNPPETVGAGRALWDDDKGDES